MGNNLIRKWHNLNKSYKLAFISSFIIGLMIHLYMFTNKLPNHDYSYNIYDDQFWHPLSLGR